MKQHLIRAVTLLIITLAAPAAEPAPREWIDKPLSLADALDLALQHNSAIAKGRADLEAAYGIAVQTRAIAVPKLRFNGAFQVTDPNAIDQPPIPGGVLNITDQRWNLGVRLVQSIYEGGRITAALRSARLTKEQALAAFQTVISDTLTDVRVAYYDVLLAEQNIRVSEAQVKLLTRELEDQRRRFDAGTVPQFNVLRAEVELANAQPRLIRARNAYRISKNNLSNLLGYNLPRDVWEDIPLKLTGVLEETPYAIELPVAIQQAFERRPELTALRKTESLRREDITSARAGLRPSVQLFAGLTSANTQFTDDLRDDITGWNAGAQVTWDLFDGWLTRGKVSEARARHRRAVEDVDDTARRIELEVRTAYSNFIEAREVLASQKKVVEQAEEALRLATARSDAGTGTQLDVLSAQTALTDARTTQIQALREYNVALARLERAIGQPISSPGPVAK
jgi:outer membrane protein TolC